MEKTLKEILEGLLNTLDPSKEVVTESIRNDISTKFITAVTEAVSSAVAAEKETMDEAVAGQLEDLNKQIDTLTESHKTELATLVEQNEQKVTSIDEAFASLLEFTVEQFDAAAVKKLEECKAAFDAALDTEIEDLCETVETIIDNKLQESNTDEDISGLAKLEKLEAAFESMRTIFFKDGILDSKITEAVGDMKSDYDKLLAANIAMTKKLNKIEVDTYLESETEGMKPALKDYLVERFANAKLEDIKEAWETAQDDYKALDEENRRLARKSAEPAKVDGKIDEQEKEEGEETEINEADTYYQNAAAGYAKFL